MKMFIVGVGPQIVGLTFWYPKVFNVEKPVKIGNWNFPKYIYEFL